MGLVKHEMIVNPISYHITTQETRGIKHIHVEGSIFALTPVTRLVNQVNGFFGYFWVVNQLINFLAGFFVTCKGAVNKKGEIISLLQLISLKPLYQNGVVIIFEGGTRGSDGV